MIYENVLFSARFVNIWINLANSVVNASTARLYHLYDGRDVNQSLVDVMLLRVFQGVEETQVDDVRLFDDNVQQNRRFDWYWKPI